MCPVETSSRQLHMQLWTSGKSGQRLRVCPHYTVFGTMRSTGRVGEMRRLSRKISEDSKSRGGKGDLCHCHSSPENWGVEGQRENKLCNNPAQVVLWREIMSIFPNDD